MDRALRELRGKVNPHYATLPYGGIVFVIMGDFRQTLPVIPKANRAQIVNATFKKSLLWGDFAEYNLAENMRVKIAMATGDAGDAHALQQHADFLLAVGDGTVQSLPDGDLIRVPGEFLCAGLAGPALRGLITLRVPARPHPRPRCARLRNRRRRAPRPDPRPN